MAFAGTKMVNQLEGSWPATVLSNAPGVGPWLGLIASEIHFADSLWSRKKGQVRLVSLIFLLRFTIANAISCTICP